MTATKPLRTRRPEADIAEILRDVETYNVAFVARKWGFASARSLSTSLVRWRKRLGLEVDRKNPKRHEILAALETRSMADVAAEYGYSASGTLHKSVERWKKYE